MTARAVIPPRLKADAAKGRVVILSNDSIQAESVRLVVETTGARVSGVCCNPRHALQTVEELQPDLVLASIFFDGEPHGIELSRRIQGDLRIPVIYLGEADDPLLVLQISMTQPAGLISDLADEKYLQAVVSRALKGGRAAAVDAPY